MKETTLTKAQLMAQITELQKQLGGSTEISEPVKSKNEDKIQQDEYIDVMSLLPYNLNLSTKKDGSGVTKSFTRMGELKGILFGDLMDIIDNHRNFAESGAFYILDPRVVRRAGLDSFYSKILTKDKIEEVIKAKSENCVALYKSCNERQQLLMVQLLIEKIRDNPESVDLNVVSSISTLSSIRIMDMAEDAREFYKENGVETN